MSEFLAQCEEVFGEKDLYKVLGVRKTVKDADIRKAYYKVSLKVHPDKATPKDREDATKRFQILGRVYSVLGDPEKRKIYDETGTVLDDEDIVMDQRDWTAYWRSLFGRVTLQDVENYEKGYVASEEERKDLLELYRKHKGNLDRVFSDLWFYKTEDEDRYRQILQDAIAVEEVPAFDAFVREPESKRAKRQKKGAKEAQEAKEMLTSLGGPSSSLHEAIAQRQTQREKQQDALIQHLMDKYVKDAPKKKGAKRAGAETSPKGLTDSDDSEEPPKRRKGHPPEKSPNPRKGRKSPKTSKRQTNPAVAPGKSKRGKKR
ncbi:unnamed protein product [Darwinula stevensoni]|uniref:J domain-containing protein n=1 Tax=Darwinula stevensoni TaxID=69355 RepID=A0A7R8X5P8_9CRUS|nr:unnamed protein product [Darwinula stevensoni]CAG0881163.1 unnamed protein product [Darwinula stevensoni]